jgi:nucleoside-diphosphate-sugar epimerase
MRALVTGAAGFIGSHLVEALVADGHDVHAIDAFTPYYDPALKRCQADALPVPVETVDLCAGDLGPLVDVDVVFHLAGQPGVRLSFGTGFDEYLRWNVASTQRLLEACVHGGQPRVVYSSSSSVYGAAERFPVSEDDLPRPVSPYGVTKLAAEHLCRLYSANFGLPTVSLRYFTVYGPRQRPDMAMHRLIRCALTGEAFPLNGDGSQVRDFTYVSDAIRSNLLAATAEVPSGSVYNIGGGSAISMAQVIEIVEELTGRTIVLDRRPAAPGDPARTGADVSRASGELGWSPQVPIRTGLAREHEWLSGLLTGR